MYYNNNYGTHLVNSSTDIWTIASLLIAICGGIVIYFTFLNPNNAKNYTGFTEKLYKYLSFSKLSIEAILKICYLIVTIFVTITSFSYISTNFVLFIVYLVFGNVIVRLIFESALLVLMMYHKINDINDKLTNTKDVKKGEK